MAVSPASVHPMQDDTGAPKTVIAVYNPGSGSRRAKQLQELSFPHKIDSPRVDLYCYNLKDKHSFRKALEHVEKIASSKESTSAPIETARPACWVLSCGGDGTIPAIVGALHQRNVPVFNKRIAFAVLPFGTANILAKFTGWGASMSRGFIDELPELIREVIQASVVTVDLMQVQVDGFEESKDGSAAKPTQATHYMILQCCIGLEARFGRFIEQHRTRSRVCNMLVSSINVIKQLFRPHPNIGRLIKSISSETQTWSSKELDAHPCIQVTLQNVPVAGGTDFSLWNSQSTVVGGEIPKQNVDDGSIEMFVYPHKRRYIANNVGAAAGVKTQIEVLGQLKCPVTVKFHESEKGINKAFVYIGMCP
ncbi:ATP-NAD kinase-like domain-containing protein [Gaertneriomyces semiglobifer]|nr:ATP-NAD kinase-like domain-containing protein [Gaertneriomyces semiglobifer]